MVLIDTAGTLESEDPFAAELETITETIIKPIVRRTLHSTLNTVDTRTRNQDALELVSDIQVMLIAAVAAQKSNRGGTIRDLRGYAARTAANACYHYFRTNFPERTRQENKLRYALKHMNEASLWKADDGRWLCGTSVRMGLKRSSPVPIDPSICRTWVAMETREGYLNAVRSVLSMSDGPVLITDLVDLIMETVGIREANTVSIHDSQNADDAAPRFEGTQRIRTEESDPTDHLKRLWHVLGQMELSYRKVLLLNLRFKGGDLVKILPLCGIASIHEIAGVLGFTDDEFAAVLKSLPWDDKRIAEHLGVTRQRVVNLRKYVRARLFRVTGA